MGLNVGAFKLVIIFQQPLNSPLDSADRMFFLAQHFFSFFQLNLQFF